MIACVPARAGCDGGVTMRVLIVLVVALLFCLFMGVTAVSLGLGAAFPGINLVAKPLVCPDGELSHRTSTTNPLPGRTYVQASYTCVDRAGNAEPISTFAVALVAGSLYGLAMYAGFLALFGLRRLLRGKGPDPAAGSR